ncbi:faeA [Symbiodinium sp. CCMP2592]|nr:faeA [Symbiodinium sp. CCMP2592]
MASSMGSSWKALAGILLVMVGLAIADAQAEAELVGPSDEEIMALFHPSIALAMGRLAAYSYCGNKLEAARVEQCPACDRAGFEVVKGSVEKLFVPFHGDPEANFFILGQFVRTNDDAKDVPSKGCFVVTRGSSNKANWVSNFQMGMMDPEWSQCPDCRLHKGYFGVYDRALPGIQKYLDAHGCSREDGDSVWITGHSLGGAVSSIMIAGLTNLGYNVALSYVLEPPMTGNEAYRQYFLNSVARNHQPVPVIRLTNGQDTAPSYPWNTKHAPYVPLPYEFFSDPVWGTHRICRNASTDCAAGVDHRQFWPENSIYTDHVILWYAPHHLMTSAWRVPQWCTVNPDPVWTYMEFAGVSMYVFIFQAGLWNAVIRSLLLVILVGILVALCVRCSCRGHKCLGNHYKRIPDK